MSSDAQLTQVLYVIQPEFDPNETDKFIIVTSGIIIENESVQTILDNNALKLAIETAITAAVSSVANKPPYEFAYEQDNDDVVITFKIELKNPDAETCWCNRLKRVLCFCERRF